MPKKRILSFILCIIMLGSCLPSSFVFADSGAKNERAVYLHAQGDSPDGTDRSEVYMGEDTGVYLAIDNPNKGLYENGEGGLELFAKNNSEKLEDQTFFIRR